MKAAVVGFGSIGGLVGILFHNNNNDNDDDNVIFFGRRELDEDVKEFCALGINSSDKREKVVRRNEFNYTVDPRRLSDCDLILLAVKCVATSECVKNIYKYLKDGVVILSLQNGIDNVSVIQAAIKDAAETDDNGGKEAKKSHVYSTMVAFNVILDTRLNSLFFMQTTSGPLVIDANAKKHECVVEFVNKCQQDHRNNSIGGSVDAIFSHDILGVQYSKLLINLINSVNALSGVPLVETLSDSSYRQIISIAINEGINVLNACNKPMTNIGIKLRPSLTATMMSLPNWLFFKIAAAAIKIHPKAKSSMLEDFLSVTNNKKKIVQTEIDFLNGEIVRLAKSHNPPIPTPVNDALIQLIKKAELDNNGPPHIPSQQILSLIAKNQLLLCHTCTNNDNNNNNTNNNNNNNMMLITATALAIISAIGYYFYFQNN